MTELARMLALRDEKSLGNWEEAFANEQLLSASE